MPGKKAMIVISRGKSARENGYLARTEEQLKLAVCTHEGSHLGRSVTDITKLCPQSTILEGLAVRGGDVKKCAERRI